MKVASFWIGDALKAAQGGRKKVGRAKVEKKQKVELVQRWIAGNMDPAGAVTGSVNITFTDDATKTRDAFVAPKNRNGGKTVTKAQAKKKTVTIPALELSASSAGLVAETTQEEPKADIGKLDDLADCLLQAAAWAKWEQNRAILKHMMSLDQVKQMVEWVEHSRGVHE
jgi:cruciform cutting endonuclease 1